MKRRRKKAQPALIAHLNPEYSEATTESGELERPKLFRRAIDCGGNPEIADRCDVRGTGRRMIGPSIDGSNFVRR